MSVNYLSIEQIVELSNKITAKVENVYVGISVWMGGDPIEPFSVENYRNLTIKFLNSSEIKGDNPEKYVAPPKLLSDLQNQLNSLNSEKATPDMVTTLLKAFIFIKRKNAAPNWMFLFYTEPPKQPQITKHNSSSRVLSPSSVGKQQSQNYQQSNQRNQRGREQNQNSNYPPNNKVEYGQYLIRASDKPKISSGPKMDFLPFSSLNSFDAKIPSTHGLISPKQSDLDSTALKKSAFINLLKEHFYLKPHLKLIVDRTNGHISIMNIDPDENFITSEFQFCSLHSGRIVDSFQPISMDIISTLSSDCCGYLTSNADCYDMCHKCVSSVIDDAETAEINKQRNNIKTILQTLTTEIEEFTNKTTKLDTLEKELFQAKQNANVESKRFDVELGNSEGSIQNLQHLITHPYFTKVKKITQNRKKDIIEEVAAEIPIMSYTPLSSFFDNFDNIVDQMEDITFTFTIDGVTIPFDRRYTSIIIANHSNAKSVVNHGKYKVVKIIQQGITLLQMEFHGVNIVLNPNDSLAIMEQFNFSNANGVEFVFVDVNITPVYTKDSYQKLILELGKIFATQLDISEIISDRLDVFQYLGACFLSEFSDIVNLLKLVRTSPDVMRKYSIVHSKEVNRCDILFTQIDSMVNEISHQLQEKDLTDLYDITLVSGETPEDDIKISVEKEVALEILNEISDFPKFVKDENTDSLFVIFTDEYNEYYVSVYDIDDFFKQLRSNLDILSKRAQNEDDENNQHFNLTKSNLEGDKSENGWTRSTSPILIDRNTEFDFLERFSSYSFGSKKSQKTKKSSKKYLSNNDLKSETASQVSGKTGITMLTEITSNYNRTYFDESFRIGEYEFTGFDAESLVNKYYMIKGTDFENEVVKIRISKLPLIENNSKYIKVTLFEEEAESDTPWFMEHSDNFTLLLVMILFGSNVKNFRFPNNDEKKLKYQLDKLNPYNFKNKMALGIPLSQANKGRQLRKFADKMEVIDKIIIQTKKKAIETLGSEITDVVFTGIIQNGQSVNFENKDITIPIAGTIMEERIRLIDDYENNILPFIFECYRDDQLSNDQQLIYFNIRDFVVFSSEIPKHVVLNDSIIPEIPLYTTYNPSYISNRSIFNPIVDKYAIDVKRLSELYSTKANQDLINVMQSLFPNLENINLRQVIPVLDDLELNELDLNITANTFGSQLILLSMTSVFSQIIHLMKTIPKDSEYIRQNPTKSAVDYVNIFDLKDPDIEYLQLLFQEVNVCINWILGKKIGRKAVGDIPSESDFPEYLEELFSKIEDSLRRIPTTVINGVNCDLINLYLAFIDSFSGVHDVLINRRIDMMTYMISLISNIYDVKIGQNLQLQKEIKYASFSESIPKGFNIYEVARDNVTNLINNMKFRKTDDNIKIKPGFPTEDIDLYMRYNVFTKFKSILLSAPNKIQFDNIMRCVAYYLFTFSKKIIRETKRNIYDFYLSINLSNVMNSIGGNILALLKQEQNIMISELPLIFKIREDRDNANLVVALSVTKIKKMKNEIEGERQILIDKFVQYASVIDIIVKSYKSRKQSYGKKDSIFDDLIKDLSTNLDFIRRDYDNVKNLDVKIILSIFDDNSRIFDLRRRIFVEFKFDQNSMDLFGYCFSSAVNIFISNYKSSSKDQIKTLNEQLSKYNLTLESRTSELENRLSQIVNIDERDELRHKFIICKITQYLFDMISVESIRIKDKLFTKKVEIFTIPHKQNQPKIKGYGSILNNGIALSPPIVDEFTFRDIQTLGKNINQLLDSILNGLSIIDCGPGMHTLSDLLEYFISYLNYLYRGDDKSGIVLVKVREYYAKFIKASDKTVNDIINSSEFDTFVNIINGTFDSLETTISSIPYFRSGEMPYPKMNNVTTNFFKGILLSIHDIISAGELRISDLLTNITNNTGSNYSFENFTSLISNIEDMNKCVITFIDEYVDENGVIIDPESVYELRKIYNLTTTGEFMNRLFEKLNYCIRRYILDKEDQFKSKAVDRLRVYIELFHGKMNILKNLEKFIMMR